MIVSIVYHYTYKGKTSEVMAHGSSFPETVTMLLRSVEAEQATPELFSAIAELATIHSGKASGDSNAVPMPQQWRNVAVVAGTKDTLRLKVVTPMDLDPVCQQNRRAECKVFQRRTQELWLDIDKLISSESQLGPFQILAHQQVGDSLDAVSRVLRTFEAFMG